MDVLKQKSRIKVSSRIVTLPESSPISSYKEDYIAFQQKIEGSLQALG